MSTITVSNHRKRWWPIRTVDSGWVINTEVVTVTKPGGKLVIPLSGNGMAMTREISLTVTAEYATILKITNELGILFALPSDYLEIYER